MALISCPECGREVSDQAEKCMGCGIAINPQHKHMIPALLSFWVPGLGQLVKLDFARFLVVWALIFACASPIGRPNVDVMLPLIGIAVIWGYQIYDAYAHSPDEGDSRTLIKAVSNLPAAFFEMTNDFKRVGWELTHSGRDQQAQRGTGKLQIAIPIALGLLILATMLFHR